MHSTTAIPGLRPRQMGAALLIYAATTAASVWLGAQKPPTLASTLASSAATAAGTLAMAFYLVRWTRYPRWGFLGSAAILAASALVSPLVARDPAGWMEDVRPMLWLNPWFLMVVGLTPSSSKRSACAPEAPWSGWLLVGAAALLTPIVWSAVTFGLRS
jgi:hypothetical protein